MVGNVDVTVILEAPKIRDAVDAMRAAVAAAIGIDAVAREHQGEDQRGRRRRWPRRSRLPRTPWRCCEHD